MEAWTTEHEQKCYSIIQDTFIFHMHFSSRKELPIAIFFFLWQPLSSGINVFFKPVSQMGAPLEIPTESSYHFISSTLFYLNSYFLMRNSV